jgi:hypothetical protein
MAIRGIEERIIWFDSHRPAEVGMCAKYTWESFGGLPRWNTADANAVVAKARSAGVLHTDDDPPRGAIVLWTSRTHGHMALSLGGRRIISTDYPNARDTGEASITMPREKWGHTWAGWLDTYAGVRFDVGTPTGGTMGLYYYSGKPSGQLTVKQEYVYLDIEEWDPPKAGVEIIETYLNCSGFVFTGGQPGRIRVCLERNLNDSDRTGYQDYTVVPGQQELLITHLHFEQGDGTRTWSMFKCMDGLQSMTVGTRYQKRAIIA